MFYVYIHSPTGTELIGKGTREECKAIIDKKEATWQVGDMWTTELTNQPKKETNYWD